MQGVHVDVCVFVLANRRPHMNCHFMNSLIHIKILSDVHNEFLNEQYTNRRMEWMHHTVHTMSHTQMRCCWCASMYESCCHKENLRKKKTTNHRFGISDDTKRRYGWTQCTVKCMQLQTMIGVDRCGPIMMNSNSPKPTINTRKMNKENVENHLKEKKKTINGILKRWNHRPQFRNI